MKNSIFKGLSSLILMGVALSLIGLEVAKAQVSSLKITDSSGREVIVYKESHALVIWAGDYQHWDKLNNIEDEAKDVVTALKRQGFEVTVVANPTGQTLKQAMETFITNYGYTSDSRLVIFFSGHGFTRKKTKGYLVPVDAPDPASNPQSQQAFLKVALDMEQVESWARQIEAKHVLFVFDSCFSGTIFKQRSSLEKPLYIQSVMNKPVRQFLTAGDADQRVPAKSVFTPLFIRALEGEADVINRDGYVTGNELGNYLKQNLSEYTKTQTPQFGTIRDPDLDQGDIVFRALNAPQFVAINSSRPTINLSPIEINANRSPKNNSRTTEVEKLISLAETKIDKKDYQGAMQDANKAIEIDPDSSQAYLNRGRAYLKLNDYQKAIADFNRAIKLKPENSIAYNGRGVSKAGLKDYQGAIADYNQAIQINKNWGSLGLAFAYNNRGVSKDNLKDNQGAIADYNQAIKLKPDYADAHYNRGFILAHDLNQYQQALSDFDLVIRLNPKSAGAYAERGNIYYQEGEIQKAIEDYTQAITISPEYSQAYYNRGIAYYKKKKPNLALNDFEQAARLFHDQNDHVNYQRAIERIQEMKGD
jgi:tetratricopeptide (TPR) repeat protein